jgi:hypothetical protein
MLCDFLSVAATDGEELAKIQKVKVLRNDKREGENVTFVE